MPHLHRIAALAALACLTACDSPAPSAGAAKSWRHTGATAPYQLDLSHGWRAEDVSAINAHADFAASLDGELLLVIIPQQLPEQPADLDLPPTSALDLKDASIALLQEQTPDFTFEREGPVVLDGQPGQAVWAEGTSEDARVQYLITYVTSGRWGFQIVAIAPADQDKRLADEVDLALRTWRFLPQPATTAPATH
jgi:hypothetical protein